MNIFCHMKCLFFGSNLTTTYDRKQSLQDNFIAMCSLPIHKTQHKETQLLLDILGVFELKSFSQNSDLSLEDKKYNVAVLEIVKQALLYWKAKREKVSTRKELVDKFFIAISSMQTSLQPQFGNKQNYSGEFLTDDSTLLYNHLIYLQYNPNDKSRRKELNAVLERLKQSTQVNEHTSLVRRGAIQ